MQKIHVTIERRAFLGYEWVVTEEQSGYRIEEEG